MTYDFEALRERIRTRLTNGGLFWPTGNTTVRRGAGRPCEVCGQSIEPESLERDVPGPARDSVVVHDDCYRLWKEESRKLQAQRSLPD